MGLAMRLWRPNHRYHHDSYPAVMAFMFSIDEDDVDELFLNNNDGEALGPGDVADRIDAFLEREEG